MKTADTLHEITGQESGIVLYDDGSYVVTNWSAYAGLPRMLGPIAIGMSEQLNYRKTRIPAGAITLIRAHEQEEEGTAQSRRGDLSAWRVNDEATIVTSIWWN